MTPTQALDSLVTKVEDTLSGEPVRFIGTAAVVAVVAVSRGLVYFGYWPEAPDLAATTVAVGGAIVAVQEGLRQLVYSPKTVAAIILDEQDGDTT